MVLVLRLRERTTTGLLLRIRTAMRNVGRESEAARGPGAHLHLLPWTCDEQRYQTVVLCLLCLPISDSPPKKNAFNTQITVFIMIYVQMVNYRRFLATVMSQKPVNRRLRTMIWQLWWRGGTHDLTLDGHKHDILVTSVYLPQVSPDTHSKTKPKERIDSWVSCALAIQSWDRIPIREFVRRLCTNHYTAGGTQRSSSGKE